MDTKVKEGYGVINPRRACAGRVTVLGLCVCLCVSVCVCVSVTQRDSLSSPGLKRLRHLIKYS